MFKKLMTSILAFAMVAGMSVSAFAETTDVSTTTQVGESQSSNSELYIEYRMNVC